MSANAKFCLMLMTNWHWEREQISPSSLRETYLNCRWGLLMISLMVSWWFVLLLSDLWFQLRWWKNLDSQAERSWNKLSPPPAWICFKVFLLFFFISHEGASQVRNVTKQKITKQNREKTGCKSIYTVYVCVSISILLLSVFAVQTGSYRSQWDLHSGQYDCQNVMLSEVRGAWGLLSIWQQTCTEACVCVCVELSVSVCVEVCVRPSALLRCSSSESGLPWWALLQLSTQTSAVRAAPPPDCVCVSAAIWTQIHLNHNTHTHTHWRALNWRAQSL